VEAQRKINRKELKLQPVTSGNLVCNEVSSVNTRGTLGDIPCKLSPVMKPSRQMFLCTVTCKKNILPVHLDHIKGKKAVVMTNIR